MKSEINKLFGLTKIVFIFVCEAFILTMILLKGFHFFPKYIYIAAPFAIFQGFYQFYKNIINYFMVIHLNSDGLILTYKVNDKFNLKNDLEIPYCDINKIKFNNKRFFTAMEFIEIYYKTTKKSKNIVKLFDSHKNIYSIFLSLAEKLDKDLISSNDVDYVNKKKILKGWNSLHLEFRLYLVLITYLILFMLYHHYKHLFFN